MSTLPPISPELIKAYQDKITQSSSGATAKRKAISLNRFFDWAESEGKIPQNPMAGEKVEAIVEPVKAKNKVGVKTWATIGVTTGLIILIFLLTLKLKLPIPFTINFAQEANIQTIENNKPVADLPTNVPGSIPASTAGIGAWNLFTKLKLTDSTGNPQVGSMSLNFKIFDSEKDGTALYTSPSQSITTDSDGS